jgi:c(7)-type cytochrome triheme protein
MIKTISGLLASLLLLSFAFAETNKGDITFKLKKADPVVFSHDYHTKSRGIRCAACHFQTFSASGNSFQMKKEKLTKQDFCEHCHNGMKGFDAKGGKNCTRCHKK